MYLTFIALDGKQKGGFKDLLDSNDSLESAMLNLINVVSKEPYTNSKYTSHIVNTETLKIEYENNQN